VFTAAALLGSRNVVVASMVVLPGLARGLTGLGQETGALRRSIFRPAAIALTGIGALSIVVAARGPVYSFNGYPVAAVAWAGQQGMLTPDAHIVSRDFVGNYLELRFGTAVKVFFDDRFDMYPKKVLEDFDALNRGSPSWDRIIDSYRPTAVLWPTKEAIGQYLASSPRWRVVYTDEEYLIAVPR
jgi:hypothetical protein